MHLLNVQGEDDNSTLNAEAPLALCWRELGLPAKAGGGAGSGGWAGGSGVIGDATGGWECKTMLYHFRVQLRKVEAVVCGLHRHKCSKVGAQCVCFFVLCKRQ